METKFFLVIQINLILTLDENWNDQEIQLTIPKYEIYKIGMAYVCIYPTAQARCDKRLIFHAEFIWFEFRVNLLLDHQLQYQRLKRTVIDAYLSKED